MDSTTNRLHCEARELAELIATRIAKLEPEQAILADVDRLRALLSEIAERVDEEGRPR